MVAVSQVNYSAYRTFPLIQLDRAVMDQGGAQDGSRHRTTSADGRGVRTHVTANALRKQLTKMGLQGRISSEAFTLLLQYVIQNKGDIDKLNDLLEIAKQGTDAGRRWMLWSELRCTSVDPTPAGCAPMQTPRTAATPPSARRRWTPPSASRPSGPPVTPKWWRLSAHSTSPKSRMTPSASACTQTASGSPACCLLHRWVGGIKACGRSQSWPPGGEVDEPSAHACKHARTYVSRALSPPERACQCRTTVAWLTGPTRQRTVTHQ